MKTYLKQSTPEQREELARKVGSSVGYFYQIAGSHKKPGAQLCKKLIAAEPSFNLHELRPDIWAPIHRRRSTDPKPKESTEQ